MVDSLSSLEKVYAKWDERNPWKAKSGAGGNHGNNGRRLNPVEYQACIDRGRKVWKDQFGDMGPPPPNRKYSRGSRRNGNTQPAVTSMTASNLGQFKVYPSIMPTAGRSRPFMGRCCACMPNSKNEFFHDTMKESGVRDVLYIEDSDRDLISRHFKKLAFVLSRRTDHKFTDVSLAVLTSPRLVDAINKTVIEKLGEEAGTKQISKKAKELKRLTKGKLKALRAAISNRLVRVTAWVLHQVLGRFLDSVLVHKGQMEMVAKAIERDLPVVYLPTHRSHLDYILVTFILFNYNLQAPYVAAGDNLRIPMFGPILRGLGGFFIRRKLDRGGKKDHVYRAILHTYMQEVLRANEHMEFFIEGGRTRSGKALYPKGGLLSVVVDCYNEGTIPDALIIPINISYDKLLDGNFNREQMGEEKISETFLGTLRAIWRVIQGTYGHVRVDFAQPFSLKEYLQVSQGFQSVSLASSGSLSPNSDTNNTQDVHSIMSSSSTESNTSQSLAESSPPIRPLKRRGSCHSLYGTEVVVEDMKTTIQGLAEHIVRMWLLSQSVMSTHILAFLLMTRYRQGAPLSTVIEEFDWLKEEVVHRKHDLGFMGRTEDVILHACDMLSDLIERKTVCEDSSTEEIHLFPVVRLPHVFQLSYNANVVCTIFALESILANAIFSLVDVEAWSEQGFGEDTVQLSQDAIIKRAIQLCHLFKYEFILKAPCQSFESVLEDCLEEFLTSEILLTHQEESRYRDTREEHWSQNLANSLSCVEEDSEEEWETCVVYKLNKTCDISMRKFWFLHSVVGPLVETYFITACNLVLLQSQDWQETEFTTHIHKCLKQRGETGVAQYCESASLDTLKNALRSFEQRKVIDLYEGSNGSKMVQLNSHYKKAEKLNELIVLFEGCRA